MRMSKEMKQWQTEEDLQTLVRAGEIRKDKDRLRRVRKLAKKQVEEAAKVAGDLGKMSMDDYGKARRRS